MSMAPVQVVKISALLGLGSVYLSYPVLVVVRLLVEERLFGS